MKRVSFRGGCAVLAAAMAVAACAGLPGAVSPDPWTTAGQDAERVRRATALHGAFSNTEPAFTPDGRGLLFVSERDGLPQLYLGDDRRRSAPPRRLVHLSERVSAPVPTPDGKAVIFRSDKDADENWSLFRVGLDGTGLVELTPGETLHRDPPLVADAAPDMVFYSARSNRGTGTTVYASSAMKADAPREIFRSDKPGMLTDVSHDGRYGLFLSVPSWSENHLFRIDLRNGAARRLYPQSGKVAINDADFSADGRRVLVATDGGGEQGLLLALDVEDGRERVRYVERAPATAELQSVSVSRRHERVAVAVSAGNRSELRLLDARTLRPLTPVRVPLGTYRGGSVKQGSFSALSFARDGSRFAVSWSTPERPLDVYSIGARSGKMSPLRDEPRAVLADLPPLDVSIETIRSFDGLEIPINVYRTRGSAKPSPVIVWYHGGPTLSSQIRWSPVWRFFLGEGYVVVEPNVRGSGGFGRAFEEADNGPRRVDAFRDVEAAARWAAAQPWADPQRMIVFGASYGGYTTLMSLALHADLWRAGIDAFGFYDLKTAMATTAGYLREVFLLEFGDPDVDGDLFQALSPSHHVGRIVDPLFVYAGANDVRTPLAESDQIVAALRAREVPVEYMVKQNEGHSLMRRENQVEFLVRTARFLERHAQ